MAITISKTLGTKTLVELYFQVIPFLTTLIWRLYAITNPGCIQLGKKHVTIPIWFTLCRITTTFWVTVKMTKKRIAKHKIYTKQAMKKVFQNGSRYCVIAARCAISSNWEMGILPHRNDPSLNSEAERYKKLLTDALIISSPRVTGSS